MRACKRRVDRAHPAACGADAGEVQRLPRVSGVGVPSQTRIPAARSVAATESVCTHAGPARIRWAQLLERAFEIDLECPIGGGDLNLRAVTIETPVIERSHSPIRIATLALRTAACGPRAYKFVGVLWVANPAPHDIVLLWSRAAMLVDIGGARQLPPSWGCLKAGCTSRLAASQREPRAVFCCGAPTCRSLSPRPLHGSRPTPIN